MTAIYRRLKVGEGTYGVCYSAEMWTTASDQDSENQSNHMIKKDVVVKRAFSDYTSSWIGGIREIDTLAQLRGHDCIISLESITLGDPFTSNNPMTPQLGKTRNMKDDKLHLITSLEEMSGDQFIRDRQNFTFQDLKTISCQLLLGLEYIHGKGYAHRDLKPCNTLVSIVKGIPYLKICDFGLSRYLSGTSNSTPGVMTSWYRAPEVCLGCTNYNLSCDMWSVGCLLFEFISGRPFLYATTDIDSNDAAFTRAYSRVPKEPSKILIAKLHAKARTKVTLTHEQFAPRFSFKDQIDLSVREILDFDKTHGSYDQYLDLLNHLLVFDPSERYTATEALNHPFFAGYKPYIDDMRVKFPPSSLLPSQPEVRIVKCKERVWAASFIKSIYDARDGPHIGVWYRHDVIFHALDLFDRYLAWLETQKISGIDPFPTRNPNYQGRFLSWETTKVYIYTCIYMMHKYYATLNFPLSWDRIFPKDLLDRRAQIEKVAETFEFHLLKDVLQYRCFNLTILEMFDYYGIKPSSENFYVVLKFYLQQTEYTGNIENLFSRIDIASTYLPSPPVLINNMSRCTSAPGSLAALASGAEMSPLMYDSKNAIPPPSPLELSPVKLMSTNQFAEDKDNESFQIHISSSGLIDKQLESLMLTLPVRYN